MIEATQKKLRETRFFLGLLEKENRLVFRNEPEAFDYLMSAFVSTARSVTFALQAEEKDKYDRWMPGWWEAHSREDRDLMDLMKEQRNSEQKKGCGDRRIEREHVPFTELLCEGLGVRVSWCAPPGVPPPQLERCTQYLNDKGQEPEALEACRRYCVLLTELVDDFIRAHSAPERGS